MNYYFLENYDIGYQELGLFSNKYTALAFACNIIKQAKYGKTYHLRDADDNILADIRAGVNPSYVWKN